MQNNPLQNPDPFASELSHTPLQSISTPNGEIQLGSSVRLHPLGRSDILDLALDNKLAKILSIEQDFEGRIYLAVSVDDDPGNDFAATGKPGHRFFFGLEEVELIPIPSITKAP